MDLYQAFSSISCSSSIPPCCRRPRRHRRKGGEGQESGADARRPTPFRRLQGRRNREEETNSEGRRRRRPLPAPPFASIDARDLLSPPVRNSPSATSNGPKYSWRRAAGARVEQRGETLSGGRQRKGKARGVKLNTLRALKAPFGYVPGPPLRPLHGPVRLPLPLSYRPPDRRADRNRTILDLSLMQGHSGEKGNRFLRRNRGARCIIPTAVPWRAAGALARSIGPRCIRRSSGVARSSPGPTFSWGPRRSRGQEAQRAPDAPNRNAGGTLGQDRPWQPPSQSLDHIVLAAALQRV